LVPNSTRHAAAGKTVRNEMSAETMTRFYLHSNVLAQMIMRQGSFLEPHSLNAAFAGLVRL
jgi:hypothetical protein